ncbi:hypothetical protein F4777DRAFT_548900 [Nemania sp. FL0916]|nr:hypothetical protein F4777DRAFT_548900 [Nemania sp. FL0916]
MSLILSSSIHSNPEARLSDAIAQFESVLSTEQRGAFLAGRDLALDSRPQIRDVMGIAAEIDQQARKVGQSAQRCFGPRVTKALESIQQLVSVGDVLIGGSQNLIACGVWSLVRLSLITVSRFSTYLDKLSSLLMTTGQSAPRYQEMVALHPKSKALRNLGLEYLISMVHLCRQVVIVCNQSSMGQLKTFFKDLDVTGYQTELLKWADAIKDQLSIEEAQTNSVIRGQLEKFSNIQSKQRKLERKVAFLDALSAIDHKIGWKHARKCGDARWFLANESYKKWRDSSTDPTLLVSGKLGTGKTVMLANILDDLYLRTKDNTIAFFFCRADYPESKIARTAIGSLARQLFEMLSPNEFLSVDQKLQSSSNVLEIRDLLTPRVLSLLRNVVIVFDGIDECAQEERIQILEFMSYLVRDAKGISDLKVCLSLRRTTNTALGGEASLLAPYTTLHMPEENSDITAYIDSMLESCLESGKLVLGDPTIILDISRALTIGAKGMFLWVVLQIESICAQQTDNDIRAALRNLPKDLPDTFTAQLHHTQDTKGQYQNRLLKLLIGSLRPLTTDELQEALSVIHFNTTWDPSNLINDVYTILATGGSLIYIDEEQSTVHFIHPSVKQFLLGNFGSNKQFQIDRSLADEELAKTVLTYLGYGVFDQQIVQFRTPHVSSQKLFDNIISSTLPSSYSARSIALALLRSRNQSDHDLRKKIVDLKSREEMVASKFAFREYASAYWIQHTQKIRTYDEKFLRMMREVYELDRGSQLRVRFQAVQSPVYSHLIKSTPSGIKMRRVRTLNDDRTLHIYRTDIPVIWAVANSHHAIFSLEIKKSIGNIIHVVNYARFVQRGLGLGFAAFENIEPEMCLKLFCLTALFGDHETSIMLLFLISKSIPLAEVLDRIPKTAPNGLAFAHALVQIQAFQGFCQPRLEMKSIEHLEILNRIPASVSIFTKADHGVLGVGKMGSFGNTKHHNLGDYIVARRLSLATIRSELLALSLTEARGYSTCCQSHAGVLVGGSRLCSCCVRQIYREFVNQLGDLDRKEEDPTDGSTYKSFLFPPPRRESQNHRLIKEFSDAELKELQRIAIDAEINQKMRMMYVRKPTRYSRSETNLLKRIYCVKVSQLVGANQIV